VILLHASTNKEPSSPVTQYPLVSHKIAHLTLASASCSPAAPSRDCLRGIKLSHSSAKTACLIISIPSVKLSLSIFQLLDLQFKIKASPEQYSAVQYSSRRSNRSLRSAKMPTHQYSRVKPPQHFSLQHSRTFGTRNLTTMTRSQMMTP